MSLLGQLRTGAFLDRDRVRSYAGILVVLEVLLLLFFVLGTHGLIVPLGKSMPTTDFASFYAAGALAAEGTPALAYDQDAHLAAERRVTNPGVEYLYFYYPPVFLLICAVLAALPYLAAFYAFQAATIVPYLFVGRAVLREKGWLGWLLVLAAPAGYWAAGLGQNSFLTAALFGGGLLLVDRRPFLAGILLGLICYKPHFGLLIPIALAAGGNWRAFAGAAAAVLGAVALSALLFGWETWRIYLALAAGAHGSYEHGVIDLAAFATPFGGARLAGIPVAAAYALQALVTLVSAAAVAVVWRKRLSLPVRAAMLCAGVLISVPVALMYDMLVSTVAIFWLIRAARESGWMPWEKTLLSIVYVAPLLSRWPVGAETRFSLGAAAGIALLAVAIAAARREMGLAVRAA